MSIKIKLQTNTSDDRALVKSLTDLSTELTAIIKADTSIIDPTFIISGGVSGLAACNYVSTTGLGGRQYFVRDIITRGDGMTELRCHVDVLSTWAADIGSLEAVIERQEGSYNLMLDDGSFKVYSDSIIQTKAFTAGFSTPSYVLAVIGGDAS